MENGPKKYKILFVEDDRELAALYGARLGIEGYIVEHCYDGDKALVAGRTFKPDLILLDLMMPTLDGFGALEMFRSLVETKASKIVIMSALSQPYDIAKAKALGADDYIVKSQVLIDDVMVIIKRHLASEDGDDMMTPPPGASVAPTAG